MQMSERYRGCLLGLLAVNLGEDADTTGAVYGQIAGAHYGEEGIPERWRQRLAHRELILSMADQLHELSATYWDQ
jgi:ADP-ribosyl-[dinitrogen reductase] hydrolase